MNVIYSGHDAVQTLLNGLRDEFPTTIVYRPYESIIRVQIMDPRFNAMGRGERVAWVDDHHMRHLSYEVWEQVLMLMLLLLTPEEARWSEVNAEFEEEAPEGLITTPTYGVFPEDSPYVSPPPPAPTPPSPVAA